MKENWRDIAGYEGYYQVSNLGRVRSLDRVIIDVLGRTRKLKGLILSTTPRGRVGHLSLDLCRNSILYKKTVHQLVAETWIGPCPNGQQVRHGPNGVTDNSVSNLCYGTSSQDGFDMRRDGTHTGRPVRRSDGVEFINMAVAAEETGCSPRNIWSVCNKRRKTTGGFSWEYI